MIWVYNFSFGTYYKLLKAPFPRLSDFSYSIYFYKRKDNRIKLI